MSGVLRQLLKRLSCVDFTINFIKNQFWVVVLAQVVDEKPALNLEKKPRYFWRGLNAVFELSGQNAVVFRGLLKHLASEFIVSRSRYGYSTSDMIPFGFDADGLMLKFMDDSRVMMVDAQISEFDFDAYGVLAPRRLRLVDLPAFVNLPCDELLYALESVDKEANVRFDVTAIFKSKSMVVRETFRVPDVCPKCGKSTHESMNTLPKDKRGKDGRSFKCGCGWRGKVREKSRKKRVWSKELVRDKSKALIEVRKGGNVERYTIDVYEADNAEVPSIKLASTAVAKLTLKEFRGLLQRIAKKCETVKLETTSDGLLVQGRGDTVKAEFPIKRYTDMLLDLHAKSKVVASYNVKNLISCLPQLGDLVTISYSEKTPIKTEIQTPLSNSTITFWCAPVITD